MRDLAAQFSRALSLAQRSALIELVRRNPAVTIDELIALRKDHGAAIGSITIGELLSGAPRARAGSKSSRGNVKAFTAGPVETRTAKGREVLDTAIVKCLRQIGGKVSAEQVKAHTGAAPDQIRRSLSRLAKSRKVKRSGKARATRYELR